MVREFRTYMVGIIQASLNKFRNQFHGKVTVSLDVWKTRVANSEYSRTANSE